MNPNKKHAPITALCKDMNFKTEKQKNTYSRETGIKLLPHGNSDSGTKKWDHRDREERNPSTPKKEKKKKQKIAKKDGKFKKKKEVIFRRQNQRKVYLI